MAARVRIAFRGRGGRTLEAAALLNGGFESASPAVLLPASIATRLLSDPLSKARPATFSVAAGKATLFVVRERLKARVATADRRGPEAWLNVLVAQREEEVILSDTAIDALGVKIESFGKGLWRFARERRMRPSEPAQLW